MKYNNNNINMLVLRVFSVLVLGLCVVSEYINSDGKWKKQYFFFLLTIANIKQVRFLLYGKYNWPEECIAKKINMKELLLIL